MRVGSSALTITATLVAALVSAPLLYLGWRALEADSQFLEILLRLRTLEILFYTLLLVVVVSAGSAVLGLLLAWTTVRVNLPFRRLLGVLLVMPLALPSFVVALTFIELYGPRGLLQQLLEVLFGVERLPSVYGFAGAAILLVLLTYPFVYLSSVSALRRFDQSLVEASKATGRGVVRTLKDVLFPTLRPAIVVGTTLSALYTLSDFGAVSLLRFDTFTYVIYNQYTSTINLNLAAAFSLVLVFLSILIVALYIRRSETSGYKSTPSAVNTVKPLHLGATGWVIFTLLALFITIAFLSHVGVIVWWLIRGLSTGLDVSANLGAAFNSMYVAALAALLSVVLALPVALYISRHSGIYSRIVRLLATIGFGLPGIVLAIALVFLGINLLPFIYQTVWSLVLAYVIIFLSIPIGTVLSSLLQINPRLEEQAALLGYSRWQRFVKVVLPLALPGILVGAVTVFLLSVKELPVTLLLSPAGFSTLATEVWSNASEGFFARTALTCLILVLSGLPLTYLAFRTTLGFGRRW